ncbi:hypothetical protein C1703_35905 [Streptomyces sp. Go-475]|nr:hypothetical protein C1703_35905 [Streptomyces sp. Go-475]
MASGSAPIMGTRSVGVKTLEESKAQNRLVRGKFCSTSGQPRHSPLPSFAPVGAVPIRRRAGHDALNCKESLMRHPPPSLLQAVAGADTLVATTVVPMVSAQGAMCPWPREHTVHGQWDNGFHGSAQSTDESAASHKRTPPLDFRRRSQAGPGPEHRLVPVRHDGARHNRGRLRADRQPGASTGPVRHQTVSREIVLLADPCSEPCPDRTTCGVADAWKYLRHGDTAVSAQRPRARSPALTWWTLTCPPPERRT